MPVAAIVLIGLIFMVVWASLGIWIAEQKGRGQGEGMILGALLGPLGVIIEALLPTSR